MKSGHGEGMMNHGFSLGANRRATQPELGFDSTSSGEP